MTAPKRDRLIDPNARPVPEFVMKRLRCQHRVRITWERSKDLRCTFAYCPKCDEVRDFAKRKPSRSRMRP